METLNVVKIGGHVIDDPARLARFTADFARMPGPKILVHGGGAVASGMLRRLGIEPRMTEGRRITDRATLEVAAMVYAGLINKDIVARLHGAGCRCVGLSGADGDTIRATRRPPQPVDYGFVGDVGPGSVNVQMIERLLGGGDTPVFCAITHDGQGTLLNTNADTVAATIAAAMAGLYDVHLTYCFEKPGVLTDTARDDSAVAELDAAAYGAMKAAGAVSAGMIAKLDNAFAALGGGVSRVVVKCADDLMQAVGTTIKL